MRLFLALICLGFLPATICESSTPTMWPEDSEKPVAIYDLNSAHIWNRLYDAVYVRENQTGAKYGEDSLDPLLWEYTKHLLESKSHRRAMQVLDEFLQTHAENLIHDPVRRAMLQHDLWAVFDWLVAREPYRPGEPAYEVEKRDLQIRLAEVLRRLALSAKEIESLPDNYSRAVASGEFAKEYDPAHRDRAFLPPDLLEAHGPWVKMEGAAEVFTLPAIEHVTAASGRSRFLIFIRLPDGRKATFDYFRELWDFPQPWIVRTDAPRQTAVNPALPSFPAGTEVALVRQMTLFDKQGNLTPAPITESVQIRVFHSVTVNNQEQDFSPAGMVARSGQDFYEIRLRRPQLFANKAGGLRTVGPEEREFSTFRTFGFDNFEDPKFRFELSKSLAVLQHCVRCHNGAGIASLNSRRNLLKPNFLQLDGDYQYPARWWENDGVLYWKQSRYDWGLLSGYWKASGGTN